MSVSYPNRLEAPFQVTINFSDEHLRSAKTKSKSKPWDMKITEITSAICALLNSCCGGLLRLGFTNDFSALVATEPKLIDDTVRRIEQSVLNIIGVAAVSEAFKLQGTKADGLLFEVKPAHRLCTVEYHLYLPTDYQVNAITFGDSLAKVAALLKPQKKTTRPIFKEHCMDFFYKERMPVDIREGPTVQFKLLKDEPTSNVTLADRMTNKSNKVVNTVSAFANHEGGHLYFGIDDKTYTVQGQTANEAEMVKIQRKMLNVLSKMVWPVETPESFWKISFEPVFEKQSKSSGYKIHRRNTFVVVLSVAKCPGGVFVEEPQSYHLVNGAVTKIPFPLWKEKIKEHDNSSADKPCSHTNMASKGCRAIAPVYMYKGISAKGWSSPEVEEEYMKVTQLMEDLRNNGNWDQINNIARKVLTPKNTNADLKLAVTFQCTAAAYRQNNHKEAYKFLQSYHSLVTLAKNPAIFEVQELYSWSAIKRAERDYPESYKYTYAALQKMQLIVPGWITAWFLCNAASLLTIFASEEPDPIKKKCLIDEAECYYRQALEHAQSITAYKKATANLRHRVHINLAMLYLESSPNINNMDYNQHMSLPVLRSAQENLRAAEDFEGPPMTGFNKFYLLLAKSDLCLRYFHHDPDTNNGHMNEAIEHANNACKVAKDKKFSEVLHYAESRVTLLKKVSQEEQNVNELVDGLLKDVNNE